MEAMRPEPPKRRWRMPASSSGVVIRPRSARRIASRKSPSAAQVPSASGTLATFIALHAHVDGNRSFARTRNAQQHNIGIGQILRIAAVVVFHREFHSGDRTEIILVNRAREARVRDSLQAPRLSRGPKSGPPIRVDRMHTALIAKRLHQMTHFIVDERIKHRQSSSGLPFARCDS